METDEITRRQFIHASTLGLSAFSVAMRCRGEDSTGKRPNIILLVTDDQRYDALGCTGNVIIHTPNMDALAARGVRFERAFVTTPICAASRASIFTGLFERAHTYTFTKPPISKIYTDISYPCLMKKAGYRNGFIGKFGVKVEEGVIDEMFDWVRLTNFPYFKKKNGQWYHLTEINGDHAVEFLRGCQQNQPFCLSVSFLAPHADDPTPEQYFWPQSCNALYEDVEIPVPDTADPAFFKAHPEFLKNALNRTRWFWRFDTPEKFQAMVKGYYRMVSGVDRVIGRIREELDRLGMDKNTIIVLMGDNGYFLGERGFAGKWLMHDLSIRVPLILYDPRIPRNRQGSVIEEMVLNVDIAPTLLDYAGINVPDRMQGQSLIALMRGERVNWRTEVFCEHLWDYSEIPQSECIRTDRLKYIRYPKHPDFEELYDLENDPLEKNNLASEQRFGDQLVVFRKLCDEKILSLLDS